MLKYEILILSRLSGIHS